MTGRASQKRFAPHGRCAENEVPALVGWMGVTAECPAGWSPVSVSGEGEPGYLKVVSPDTRFLEIKWEQPRGVVSVPDALEAYLVRLRKAAKKSRQELEVKLRPRSLAGVRPQKETPIAYSWEADRKALGCIWHCGECNRMMIAEVVGQPDDDLSFAREVLKGIGEHGERDGEGRRWNTWALYGLNFAAPESYRVESQSLMTGHQRLLLRERGSTLRADRWGLAEIALKGTDLRTWYVSREAAMLSRYAYSVEEVMVGAHPGFRVRGRMRAHAAVLAVVRSGSGLVWPRFFLEGWVWRCPESNRIYAVTGEQPRKSSLVAEVVARMSCHGVRTALTPATAGGDR